MYILYIISIKQIGIPQQIVPYTSVGIPQQIVPYTSVIDLAL